MRYGLCTTPENFTFAKECGYDFVEMPLYILRDMSDEDFDTVCKTCDESDIKVETVKSEMVKSIIDLLKEYKGETEVIFYDASEKKYVKSTEIKINVDDNVIFALKNILGENNVILK